MALRLLAAVSAALSVLTAALPFPAAAVAMQEVAPTRRAFTVVAKEGGFEPDRLEVSKNDLVTITLRSEGGPHSFAIDAYRVMKRAGAGETISFEFRADQVGRFEYYCSLSSAQCRTMKGTLVVAGR
jgi:heme/copper-type cytochrome/quinol oxidase subunit 2